MGFSLACLHLFVKLKLKMMKTIKSLIYLLAIFFALQLMTDCTGEQNSTHHSNENTTEVIYPENYREWTRVKSMVILEGHENYNAFGGFHHVYANDIALGSLKKGEPFPTGAILAFELFQEIIRDRAINEGNRLVVGVMEKDTNRFADTEGWGFEDFKIVGNTYERAVNNAREQCLSCHASQRSSDFVYSTYQN